MQWHIYSAQHNHLCLPYCTKHIRHTVALIQQFNDTFYVCSSCGRIRFAVIRQKLMKHSMMCACLWCYFCLCMCWCTKVLQCNAFNRHRYISAIICRLYLVCKTSYHYLSIITTAQYILLCDASIECFTACVTTVIST